VEKILGLLVPRICGGRTTQRVSVSMVSAKQILGAARIIQKLDVQLIETRIGDLSGNGFELGRFNLVGFYLTNTFS
jgi:hypothetical protein